MATGERVDAAESGPQKGAGRAKETHNTLQLSWLHLSICLHFITAIVKDSCKMTMELTTLNSTAA